MAISKDDDIWRMILQEKLIPYVEASRKWWAEKEGHSFPTTSTFPIKGGPPGFYEKCTRSPRMSPIYGVQAFPILNAAYLTDLPRMPGGCMSLIEKICKDGLEIEEFMVISKLGLQSTLRSGLFLCFVPKKVLNAKSMARWVYLKPHEVLELVNGVVTGDLIKRLLPFAQEYRGDASDDYEPIQELKHKEFR